MGTLNKLAVVEDLGTTWGVIGIKDTNAERLDPNEVTIPLSHMASQLVDESLTAGKLIKIIKSPGGIREVVPPEIIVSDAIDPQDLDYLKYLAITGIRPYVTSMISKVAALTMYRFIILNNELSSAGYIITDGNREEQYINILETGDEKLIQQLEDYLNLRDEISRVAFIEHQFTRFRSSVQLAQTGDEINALKKPFYEYMSQVVK